MVMSGAAEVQKGIFSEVTMCLHLVLLRSPRTPLVSLHHPIDDIGRRRHLIDGGWAAAGVGKPHSH